MDVKVSSVPSIRQTEQNQRFSELACTLLADEKFDVALKAITRVQADRRLKRKLIQDYLIRLSVYLERLKPDLRLPSGWLRDESAEFVDTFKNAVALLGEDFTSCLIHLCSAVDFNRERYLLHMFLEIGLDGYLWTDMVELCLFMAGKDQKSQAPTRYDGMSEKLCNIRQIAVQSPSGSMPNPFFDGVAEEDITSGTYLRQRECEILFSPGKPTINLVDIDREIAIAMASAGIISTGVNPNKLPIKPDESLALRLFNKCMELRLYREGVLLAKYCSICEVSFVFTAFAEWIILVQTLARDHWDNFFKEIAPFLERTESLEIEKIYQKGQESPEAYVERVVDIIQSALIDLYLEHGSIDDLKKIVSCYISAQTNIFPRLNHLIADCRNFCEILWYLLESDGRHLQVFQYVADWASGITGQNCIATIPQFTLSDEEHRVELPYINASLYNAVKNYFSVGDAQVQRMWTVLEEILQRANKDGVYFRSNGRTVVTYSKPLASSSDGGSENNVDPCDEDSN